MTPSVPRHSPHVLASAGIGNLPRHMHGVGQRLGWHDDFGDHDQFVSPVDFLTGDERKAPAPASDVLDIPKARNEDIGNSEHLQKLWLLAHLDLHNAPREDRPLATYETIFASVSRSVLTHVSPRGFQSVNEATP